MNLGTGARPSYSGRRLPASAQRQLLERIQDLQAGPAEVLVVSRYDGQPVTGSVNLAPVLERHFPREKRAPKAENSQFIEAICCEIRILHGSDPARSLAAYGFMNEPEVVQALEIAGSLGLEFDIMETSFFLSRESVVQVAATRRGMSFWRRKLFALMMGNAGNAADYFKLPANRVIELGTKVEI